MAVPPLIEAAACHDGDTAASRPRPMQVKTAASLPPLEPFYGVL